ncbi:hypothetical protein [Rhodococcus sp. GA1]|uniref:hypothetical protein n=1 Tax=Rhodococcus sp. GA1 TaxID=2942275 RepID=UPI0020CF1D30|nr:hypothetical protein [Rhodococcus sp. GA1]
MSLPSSPLTGSNHAVPAVVSGHEIPHPQVPGPCAGGGAAPGDGYRFDENLWRELIAVWFPEVVDPTARAVTWPAIAAHHTWIEGQLDESVTVATIAQRLRDDHGVPVSESTVRRYISARFADRVAASKATMPRGAVPPGDEGQVESSVIRPSPPR